MANSSGTKKNFDEIRSYYEDMAAARKGDLWGFVNKEQEEVIPFLFDEVEDFQNGQARVKLNGQSGIVDSNGLFKKLIVVAVSGLNLELQAHAIVSAEEYEDDGHLAGWIDSASMFELENVRIEVDGNEYKVGKRDGIKIKNANDSAYEKLIKDTYQKYGHDDLYSNHLDVKKFAKHYKADYCELWYEKAYGDIEIVMPENEMFDPSKALILTCDWDFGKYTRKMISLFVYDGKGYYLEELGGNGGSCSGTVYGQNPNA